MTNVHHFRDQGAPPLSFYDPVTRHEAIEKLVVRDSERFQERKYWRFRFDRWYGGIVTADAVGCGLLCKYCWVSDAVMFRPATIGKFYRPDTVAHILIKMARKRSLKQLRVSGGEPTIGRQHLLQLLDSLQGRPILFILETNGVLIGDDPQYAEDLSKYRFLHVRVSLKGCSQNEFSVLTGAQPQGFNLQLKALQNLMQMGVKCHPAAMTSFSPSATQQQLIQQLRDISPKLAEDLEIEELILYPKVRRKIEEHHLSYYTAYKPEGVPKEQI